MPDPYSVDPDGHGVDTVWRHDPDRPGRPQPVARDGERHYELVRRVYAPTGEDVERLCEAQHDAYEAAAVEAGWQTQEQSRRPWGEVPEANRQTMRASVRAVLRALADGPQTGDTDG